MQPATIEHAGLIFDATTVPDNERISYFCSLLRLASGDLIAGWQNGPGKHTPGNSVRLARSRDEGTTWQLISHRFTTSWQGVAGSLAAAELAEPDAGRLLLFTTWFDRSDPDRPLFDPETEGILRAEQLYCVSEDDGDSWGDWQVMPTPGLSGCALTGPVVQWPGRLAVAFESFKQFDEPGPAHHAAWLCISDDGGRTFLPPWLVAEDPADRLYYWDQRLAATDDDGGYVALFWTHDRSAQQDLTIHLQWASLEDGDCAASKPVATSITGQIAAPAMTSDGRLLAFVVDRGQPGTMRLWQSDDRGVSWPAEASLIIHQHDELAAISQGHENIDFAEYWEDMGKWSFGHPAIQSLGEDRFLLAYYAGTPDRMSVHCARVSLCP